MIVINSIIVLGGTHAEHLPEVKTRPAQETEKDVLPGMMFFASFLYE